MQQLPSVRHATHTTTLTPHERPPPADHRWASAASSPTCRRSALCDQDLKTPVPGHVEALMEATVPRSLPPDRAYIWQDAGA